MQIINIFTKNAHILFLPSSNTFWPIFTFDFDVNLHHQKNEKQYQLINLKWKTWNNLDDLLFNLETWREGPVKYLGACGKLSGQVRYQKTIGNDCPTIFTLERKL